MSTIFTQSIYFLFTYFKIRIGKSGEEVKCFDKKKNNNYNKESNAYYSYGWPRTNKEIWKTFQSSN